VQCSPIGAVHSVHYGCSSGLFRDLGSKEAALRRNYVHAHVLLLKVQEEFGVSTAIVSITFCYA
jgi:hypothetical protein